MSYTTDNVTTTTDTPDAPKHNFQNELKYLIVPLVVVLLIILLSALVYLMARRRNQINKLRHNLLLQLYEFDSNEQEWEPLNSYDNPQYANYSTTTF